jgi:hypothetical protein
LGRKEEWPTWREKLLAKAKHSGIKDVLLGDYKSQRPLKTLREVRRKKKYDEKC